MTKKTAQFINSPLASHIGCNFLQVLNYENVVISVQKKKKLTNEHGCEKASKQLHEYPRINRIRDSAQNSKISSHRTRANNSSTKFSCAKI